MDEDLKIVLTTELEADEQASAQRISAQLPNIAKLINSKSSIKIGVSLDSSNIQSDAQKVSRQISQVTKTQGIGVTLNLDKSSVSKIQQELNNLKVSPDVSRAMTEQLDKMGVQIDRISGRWEAVNGEEERMLSLTIQGTDQMQRAVTYLQTYDTETGEINTHLTNVTANLKQQRQEAERLAAKVKADNESRVAYLQRQKSILADIQASYAGDTSAKPVHDDAHLQQLNSAYQVLNDKISELISKNGQLDKVQRASLESQISDLQRLVKEYQNAEYVATKLRTKDIGTIKKDQLSGIEALEKRLEAADTLTEDFRKRINALKTDLSNVTNKDQLVSFLNSFDQLNNDVSVFQERLRGVNSIYQQIIAVEKKITSVQSSITGMNPQTDTNKIAALRGELAVLESQRASLEGQLAPYADIVQYAKQATALEQSRLLNGTQLVYSHMELADKAKQYDAAMRQVPATIADLETKFTRLTNPTASLVENMRLLREMAAQYSSDMGAQEKVQTYERLKVLIGSCSKEMSQLLRVQNGDLGNFKFTQNLEKAKADLETVGRTWSALKHDPGLNAQFRYLQESLKQVNNQMDLTKWTAQFSTFKSEVKAAGKNMQSLGDVLKNNVGKVLQWVSATTLLFRAFRLLRSAISTIVDLDTAMVDLRKVTIATEAEYQKFYLTSNETAKRLGVTTEEIISQTAEWARLGFAMQDAAKLAENSAIFEAISPDMDITQATDGLVSIIKAFDIEVEDSMDGIISKVNDVGNKFAVSNGDVVEALTRSSSAMASANNTFEETVALATAAIEITRDAASVGNGLKTLSMRIRGYDEETEEFSEDVAILTGEIADLTKTASNPGGISLFEAGDPDTYRSTYDILADIADIWDELTDKNRAKLLEALFGKRQAQIGSAILSNFDQARSAIDKMEKSAGSADREMEKITNSLEYKLNALKETWVGVAQNLFQTDDLKAVVDGLTAISEVIGALTGQLGLFGTVGLVVAVAGLIRFSNTLKSVNTTVAPVLQTLSGVSYDNTTASALRYAAALSSLDPIQQKLAMSMLGLNAEQKEQISTMMTAIAIARQYNVAQLEQALGMQAGTIANNLNIASTTMVTEEVLKAAMANGVLRAEQLKEIVTTNAQTAANAAGAKGFLTLGASAKAAGAAMMATPMGWISLLVGVLPLAITGISKLYDWLVVTAEEAYSTAEEYKKSYDEATAEVEDLNSELETNKKRLEELYRLSDNGTITLIEQEELERLERTNAALETTIARKKEIAEMDAKEANKGYVSSYNKTNFTSNRQDVLLAEQSAIYDNPLYQKYLKWTDIYTQDEVEWVSDDELEKAGELYNRLYEINNMLSSGWDNDNDTWLNESVDYATHVEELVDTYNDLNTLQESGVALSDAQKDLLESTRAELVELADDLDEDYLSQYVGEDTNTDEWNRLLDLINKTIYAAQYFQEKLTDLPDDCYNQMEELGGEAGLTADKVTALANEFPELNAWMSESGYTAEDVANHFNAMAAAEDNAGDSTSTYEAKLSSLTDVLSDLQESYDALESAQNDMATGDGLSPDTIEALADAEENYLNYIYEENGVVKLNTEAWKENANAKMQSEMAEIQKEIDSLEKENAVLQETIDLYNEKAYDTDNMAEMDSYFRIVNEATDALKENNAAIEENQAKLALYGSLYGSITGNLDAYTSALNNFSNIANTINSVSDSFQTLADLQATVANGFTMSLDKALEFAKVYPEILNSATVSSNGQIALNENVVNSFIQGKKAELDAQIDVEIAQLEADKAVLEAKMQAAQAQLDLAKNVGEGEGQIAKELAEYRINAGNAVAEAMIDAGVDEATAFKLAALAMAQNAEEFDRVAMEVCTDVNGNFNQAAYDLAQTMYNNLTNVKTDLASVATQAHETAKAIAGIADGSVSGSSAMQGGSGGGTGSGGITLNLTKGSFEGTEYTYTAKESGLEDYISQIELDISNYQDAIAQIDGQIATLKALKNIPLKDFRSSSGSGSSSGSTKEVEEYIASIEDYREAIERLRKAQEYRAETEQRIDNTDDLKQKILLERQLIGAYAEEQSALHNLNNQRDSTISAGAKALRELGFAVQYNADTNELWIENMEHLNELTADSKGEYDTLQEATNALREETEDLINSLEDLNDANRDGSDSWWELKYSTEAAHKEILQLLDDIVSEASDAVDSIQDVYDTLHDAADEYAASGFITIDTLQSIIDLGMKYVTYLIDENGQLVINEERIRDVIAAKTQQLAIESSLSYVEALRIAKRDDDIATLNDLLYATQETTDATWGLVYANLAMAGLDQDQYQAALDNINAIRALADSAVHSIGQTADSVTDELNAMKDGVDDILKYVMDMLKQRINDQIDALEDMKDAYSEIIDKKKESLEASKDEADYSKTMAKKLREIAKLQAEIDALSLDDSREAQAEKAKLLEEMAELQEDLAEDQADKSLDAAQDALDDMETAYHAEKDKEIAILEDSISSYQKLYDMAIDYISNHWDTLYSELIAWNTQYGDVLNSEITTAWENCLAAAQRYGSYVSALNSIGADVEASKGSSSSGNSGGNLQVGKTNYDNSSSNEEMIHAIIKEMYANSQAHHAADQAGKARLSNRNLQLGSMLAQYGVYTHRDNGTWYMDGSNQLLYDKYKKYLYHKGGIAGDVGTLKDNEILATLEKGEPVLTNRMWDTVTTMVERMGRMAETFTNTPITAMLPSLPAFAKVGDTVNNVTTSNQPVQINIGDTIIQGDASPETVQQHVKVTRDMMNQIARRMGLKL